MAKRTPLTRVVSEISLAGSRRSSLKYEEVYLRAYKSASEAKHFIGRPIGRAPDAAYFNQPTAEAA